MRRRGAAAGLAALALAAPPAARADTLAAELLIAKRLHSTPGGPVTGRLAATRPLTGGPTAVPVLRIRRDRAGRTWLRVRLPRRPDGATAWISDDGVRLTARAWRLTVHTRSRTLLVFRHGRLVHRWRVVVGKPSTPTPHGAFFVAERVRQPSGGELGPWVLATSAYSRVLRQFGGGPGQIGLHGTGRLAGRPGQAASHGCIRLPDRRLAWLAPRIAPGTPLRIDP